MWDRMGKPSWYDGSCKRFLHKAQNLLKDRDAWEKDVLSGDSDEEATLCGLSLSSATIYETTEKDLEAQIARLQEQAQTELQQADHNRLKLMDRRKHGGHKLSADIESFLTNFSRFVKGYSGIVEIAKAADQQLGGFAWGTLSIFLNVAAHKTEREDDITRAVVEFSRHCPRLKILDQIYPDDNLKSHIADMYANIIEFARSATVYYRRGTAGRIVSSSNPKAKVTKSIEEISSGLVNIRMDCETLMQQRLYQLSKQVEAQNEQLRKQNEQLQQMNASLDRTQLDRNAKHLARLKVRSCVLDGLATDIPSYKSLLAHSIFQHGLYFQRPRSLTKQELDNEPNFNQWINDAESSILFLSGNNAPWINQTTLNWLSWASVLTVDSLQEENRNMAYVICQTKSLLRQSDKPSVQTALATLAFQLLEQRPAEFQGIRSQIEATLDGDAWKSDDEHDRIRSGIKIIETALQIYQPEETVYLIIDRIDQCAWTYETERLRHGVCEVLDALLRLVHAVRCKLKVIVVAASTSHRRDLRRSIAQRQRPWAMERYVERLDWDQE